MRADASENYRKLRLILAIKLIFKTKLFNLQRFEVIQRYSSNFYLKENHLPLTYCNF